MSALADLLEARIGEIVEEWRVRVVATLAPESVDQTLIVDSLPAYLQLIADDLRSQGVARQSGETINGTRIPADHGVQRFHLGYEVGAMVREYRSCATSCSTTWKPAGAASSCGRRAR